MYPLEKYRYYVYQRADGAKVVKAISTYAGRRIMGKAVCDPKDEFSLDLGKQLAAARCNAEVARRRRERAEKKVIDSYSAIVEAERKYDKAIAYFADADKAVKESWQELKELYEIL